MPGEQDDAEEQEIMDRSTKAFCCTWIILSLSCLIVLFYAVPEREHDRTWMFNFIILWLITIPVAGVLYTVVYFARKTCRNDDPQQHEHGVELEEQQLPQLPSRSISVDQSSSTTNDQVRTAYASSAALPISRTVTSIRRNPLWASRLFIGDPFIPPEIRLVVTTLSQVDDTSSEFDSSEFTSGTDSMELNEVTNSAVDLPPPYKLFEPPGYDSCLNKNGRKPTI